MRRAFAREVSTAAALGLGFLGLVLGPLLLTGLFRTGLHLMVGMATCIVLMVGIGVAGRRDVAVGMAIGMFGMIMMIVAALRSLGTGPLGLF